MELKVVPAFEVASIWPKVQGFIGSALAREGNPCSTATVLEALESGQMQLFTVGPVSEPRAAAVAQVHQHENLRRCRIHWCGGRGVDEWVDLVQGIKQWAAERGATKTIISGRKGWGRYLIGWTETGVILETENAIV